jgi:hypothetical protein
MAPILINRAPWNALIDDSGNNLDGSLWDKAAIKAVLLDPIDVALADVDDGTTKDANQDTLITNNANAIGLINTGPWTDVPFSAANFFVAQGTGTWTVTGAGAVSYCWIKLTPKTIMMAFYITGVLPGSPVSLGIFLPAAMPVPIRTTGTVFHFYGSAQNGMGLLLSESTNRLRLLKDIAGTPFAPDNNFYTVGQLIVPY